jgi:beta-glucosidase
MARRPSKASAFYAFPRGFLWGAATAAYQVEGAAAEDGRAPSIWDTFARQPGRIAMDHTGAVADDQYHRYREDVRLMQWLGLQAHRFSISWPRVQPRGEGRANPRGLAYYDRFVDDLLAHGIEPWPTLFHWDLPQALEDRYGGWAGRETALRFADYAALIARRLSDRVRSYFTMNEFFCIVDKGYAAGPGEEAFAPGRCLPPAERNQARHHALLAHGLAVQALRAHAATPPRIGLAENCQVCVPVIETEPHIAAARRAMRELNACYLTTVLEGAYPDAYLSAAGAAAPRFSDADMQAIGSPLDFVGLNTYAPTLVRASGAGAAGYEVVPFAPSHPRLEMPWLLFGPQTTYWGPRWLKEIWQVPAVYVSENGCASQDRPGPDGEINDTDRVLYLRQHFIAAQRAAAEGWPLRGYFVWSLLDNFEWCYGYTKRFGIVYVNYETQQRTPKLSAKFYREVIAAGAVV